MWISDVPWPKGNFVILCSFYIYSNCAQRRKLSSVTVIGNNCSPVAQMSIIIIIINENMITESLSKLICYLFIFHSTNHPNTSIHLSSLKCYLVLNKQKTSKCKTFHFLNLFYLFIFVKIVFFACQSLSVSSNKYRSTSPKLPLTFSS